MTGNSQEKRPFAASLNLSIANVLEILLLMMAGGLVAYMHFTVRIPLNIPGHHGLEFMAVYALVRLTSRLPYAATITMLGTGIMMLIPGAGGGSMLHGFSYLLPGLILDLAYYIGKDKIRNLIVIAMLSGLAYMCIPLTRAFLNSISGYPYMAFVKYGIAYTTLSFFFFGMMGGVLGYGLFAIKESLTKNKTQNLNEKQND